MVKEEVIAERPKPSYEHEKRLYLAEKKPELILKLRSLNRELSDAVERNQPRVIARTKREIERTEKQLDKVLKGQLPTEDAEFIIRMRLEDKEKKLSLESNNRCQIAKQITKPIEEDECQTDSNRCEIVKQIRKDIIEKECSFIPYTSEQWEEIQEFYETTSSLWIQHRPGVHTKKRIAILVKDMEGRPISYMGLKYDVPDEMVPPLKRWMNRLKIEYEENY